MLGDSRPKEAVRMESIMQAESRKLYTLVLYMYRMHNKHTHSGTMDTQCSGEYGETDGIS